jgi:hypothetical protein
VRIAIMMLIHDNEQQTQRLIDHLSGDFDIYVHIDKRYSLNIRGSKNIFVYRKYKTYHGSFEQIIATLYLLKKAFEKGYDRYILISGQDLPVKSNAEIKIFFENNTNEYVEIFKIPRTDGGNPNPTINRMTQYHRIQKWNIFLRLRRKINHVIDKELRRDEDYDFYGGSNWTNYTHECVKKIFQYLEKDKKYINRFKWTSCADEIFYQTILNKINDIYIINTSLRYVDWESGPEFPRILREEDYEKIIGSKALFGRKFDENIDRTIIDRIYGKIEE